ncbi:MAG: TVP38/TMEM64 family protein [Caulobacteraceae bacterium]
MRRLSLLFAGIDARAWRAVALWLGALVLVSALLILAAPALGLGGRAGIERWLAFARGPWALPATVAVFAALAFVGAPQVALIAAAALVFGPWAGSLYSWIGTMVSAEIGFEAGRALGGRFGHRIESPGLRRFMAAIGRNGFMASLVVRLAPAAPFIVVNMAGGAARVRRIDFTLGTALGIVPKILVVAFAGGAATGAFKGAGLVQVGFLALALVVWTLSAFAARRWFGARAGEPAP